MFTYQVCRLRDCPKHVEFHTFVKLVQLVGFIIKKFVTMHGHTNVKIKKSIICQYIH